MSSLNAYLSFGGNCREAMSFYQLCLGGELQVQTVAASPIAAQMPPDAGDKVLHSMLTTQSFLLMASDMAGPHLVTGNSVSLMLHCDTEAELDATYTKLSEGGMIVMLPSMQFWGAKFGHLTDRFGVNWLLSFDPNMVQS